MDTEWTKETREMIATIETPVYDEQILSEAATT